MKIFTLIANLFRRPRAKRQAIVWRGRVFLSCSENESVDKLRSMPVLIWRDELFAFPADQDPGTR